MLNYNPQANTEDFSCIAYIYGCMDSTALNFDPNATDDVQDQIFAGNIKHLHESDWLLCNTRNKDMGTIFEAGYFNCLEKPIVYFCDGLPPGAQFNLMLAASGIKVCTSLQELSDYLSRCIESGYLITERYQGKIE